MTNELKCLGCGALKQTAEPNKIGYVKDINHEYCLSCFNLANYGKSTGHFHPNNYLDIKSNSVIFIIQSVMQLDLLFSQPISRIQNNAKHVYIINQIDLLPKDTNKDILLRNIYRKANEHNIRYDDIIFMSAINKADIENLRAYIKKFKEKDIYLFGFQNSGKTTIFKGLTNNNKALSMNKAGLTQEIIVDTFDNVIVNDMPGNYVNGYLADFFEYDRYKNILAKKELKPRIYQLKQTQKLVINDFIELSFDNAEVVSLVLYANSENMIMKYNKNNPKNYLLGSLEYNTNSYNIKTDNMQISIADFLVIKVKNACNLKVKLPKKMHVSILEAMFK